MFNLTYGVKYKCLRERDVGPAIYLKGRSFWDLAIPVVTHLWYKKIIHQEGLGL